MWSVGLLALSELQYYFYIFTVVSVIFGISVGAYERLNFHLCVFIPAKKESVKKKLVRFPVNATTNLKI